MNTETPEFSPAAVVAAFRAIQVSFWSRLFSHLPAAAFHDDQGTFWFETAIRHDVFNRVLDARLESAAPQGRIQDVIGHFQQRRLPFMWQVATSSLVPDGGDDLEQYGLTHYETEPVMAVDLREHDDDVPVPSPLGIQPVMTDEHLEQWARICEFGSPEEVIQLWYRCYAGLCFERESPLRLFLGTVDGQPVATSEVFLGAEVAYIGAVNTLGQYRRQGAATALTRMALRYARRQGCRMGVLTASPMGITIYRRLGFREFGRYSTYLWHPQ